MINHSVKAILESELNEKIIQLPIGSGKLITESGRIFFLKSGSTSRTYQCEANGLKELKKSGKIRIADIISVGNNYILTEYIESGSHSSGFFDSFGRAFARMHKYTADCFGFYENNYIGANEQLNIPDENEKNNWIFFYFNKRLMYQYRLAEKNGFVNERLKTGFIKLESKIEDILKDSLEPPTLLHGDLWSGNFLCSLSGEAVLIDPAVYYGHREADLAMTKLFGGFPSSFYEAYRAEFPLKTGWEYREGLYKLYHVLNHLNIFGTSYLYEAEYLINQYTKNN